jgi:hypothetical protein
VSGIVRDFKALRLNIAPLMIANTTVTKITIDKCFFRYEEIFQKLFTLSSLMLFAAQQLLHLTVVLRLFEERAILSFAFFIIQLLSNYLDARSGLLSTMHAEPCHTLAVLRLRVNSQCGFILRTVIC